MSSIHLWRELKIASGFVFGADSLVYSDGISCHRFEFEGYYNRQSICGKDTFGRYFHLFAPYWASHSRETCLGGDSLFPMYSMLLDYFLLFDISRRMSSIEIYSFRR